MYLELYHMERLYNGIDDKTNQQCIWINHVIIDQTEEQAHFTPILTIILVTSRSEVLLRTSRFLIFDEANWSPGNNPFCLFASHYNNKDAHSDTQKTTCKHTKAWKSYASPDLLSKSRNGCSFSGEIPRFLTARPSTYTPLVNHGTLYCRNNL